MNLLKNTLNEKFEYVDGNFIWKKTSRKSLIGCIAGVKHPKGYTQIYICGKRYLLHRLIFLNYYGVMPSQIDHIDADKSNNRIENLRGCTDSQNRFNAHKPKNNTSGYKNIYWDKSRFKWVVNVAGEGKTLIKRFNDLSDEIYAANEARQKLHGEFARHA